jgi:hypothetical protein
MPILDTAIGVTGLTQYSGRIYEEYLRELQGPRWHRVLRRMVDSDPIIGAALFAIEMLLRQVTWDITAADESPEAQANADFIGACWSDMPPWPDTLAEILTFLPHGWAYLELCYKARRGLVYRDDGSEDTERSSRYTDGKTGWAAWAPRAQDTLDRWEFGDDGAVLGMWQIAPPTYQSTLIPIEKALHLRTTSRKGNPEGRSALRNTYRPWYFKQNIENIEGIGIERDLAGFPVVSIPSAVINTGGAVFEAYKSLVRDIKRDEQEGAVLPSDRDVHGNKYYTLELLSTGGRRQFDTNTIIQRYDTRIAMTMLADVILIGHEKVGSFALSSDKTELLSVALGAFLETICCGVQQQAFTRLLRLNGMNADLCPMLRHGDIETVDLAALGAYLESLSKAGMTIFPQPDLETYLLEQAGLPVPEGGYPPIEPPAPVVVAPPVADPNAPQPAPMGGVPA